MKIAYNKGNEFFLLTMIISVIYLSGLDIVGLELGNITIKPQLLLFPLFLCLFLIKKSFSIGKEGIAVSLLFMFFLVPSVFSSLNPFISSAFLFGAFSCVCAMLFCAGIVRTFKVSDLLCYLMIAYRLSIVITLFLVVFGFQIRGHFIFYEASYWAIFLIPYAAVFFFRLLSGKHEKIAIDAFLLFVSILLSQSASFVIWCFFIVFFLMLFMGKLKFRHVFISIAVVVIVAVLLVNFNQRASYVYSEALKINNVEGVFNVLIFLAGNRIQRILVPYYIGMESPFFGVGAGMLRTIAPTLDPNDFKIYGMSAYDFELDSSAPGVNIIIEVFSEYGSFGVIGFLVLLFYVYKSSKRCVDLLPLRVSLIVTLIALMIESNFMRYYLWVLMGFILGLYRSPSVNRMLMK